MKKTKLISLLLAVAMMLAMFAGCGGDKGGAEAADPAELVKNAISATSDEFSGLMNSSANTTLSKNMMEGTYSQDMGIYLSGLDIGGDLSDLYGTGIEVLSQSSYADRLMYAVCNIAIGGHDTLSYDVEINDADMLMRCVDIVGDIAFAMNTETLPEDLEALTGEGATGMTGYNMFDLMEQYVSSDGAFTLSETTTAGLDSAYDALMSGADYSKPEATTITCGETEIDVDCITVGFSAEVFQKYLEDLVEVMFADEYLSIMFESAAMTDGTTVEDMKNELLTGIASTLEDAEGNLTLKFYIDEFVRGIDYVQAEDDLNEISLRFGAEKVYDNIEFYIADSSIDAVCTINIAGNHSAEGGVFETTTEFIYTESDYEVLSVNITASHDNATGDFALDMMIGADGEEIGITASGNATTTDDTYNATLDDLTINIAGLSASFNGYYNAEPCDSVTAMNAGEVISIADMDDEYMEELSYTAQMNLFTILTELVEAVPLVGQLIGM